MGARSYLILIGISLFRYLQKHMRSRIRTYICWFVFLMTALAISAAQVEAPQQTADDEQQESLSTDLPSGVEPQATNSSPTGVSNASLDEFPSERPSFLLLGLFFGESAEDAPSSSGTSESITAASRAAGRADLVKFWRRSATTIDYIGGAVFGSFGNLPIQQFAASQRFMRGRREFVVSDSGSYSYGGTFGATSLGGASLYNLLSNNETTTPSTSSFSVFSGLTNFAGIRSGPFLTNVGRASFTEALNHRSSLMLTGSYGIINYEGAGQSFINSRQLAVGIDYTYELSRRDSVSVSYSYRLLKFPHTATTNFFDNLVRVGYDRTLSANARVWFGGGPEFTSYTSQTQIPLISPPLFLTVNTHQINLSAAAALTYDWKRTALSVSYDRLATNGSGVSAGANSDVVHGAARRRVFRVWEGSFDSGFARLAQIGSSSSPIKTPYQYWYVGAALRRNFGRGVSMFASYQYNRESSSEVLCNVNLLCGLQTNIGLVGVSWQARPIRLDHGGREYVTPEVSITPERQSAQ